MVTASAERGQRLTALGAAAVIYDVADLACLFGIVLESTGGKNLALALDRLAGQGTLIWFSRSGQPDSGDPEFLRHPRRAPDRTDPLVRLLGLPHPRRRRPRHPGPASRLSGCLHPEIGRLADWSATAATLNDLYHRRIRGNAVLTIG